jgi:hypothetical protein
MPERYAAFLSYAHPLIRGRADLPLYKTGAEGALSGDSALRGGSSASCKIGSAFERAGQNPGAAAQGQGHERARPLVAIARRGEASRQVQEHEPEKEPAPRTIVQTGPVAGQGGPTAGTVAAAAWRRS